jgi:S-adenosylmethionine:tRNA ribosyltransferase-isomerase
MKLSDFDYCLPKELIAQYPLPQRDEARVLVIERAKGTIEHSVFKEVLYYLKKGDLLVLNDTKVIPCRLFGKRRTGGKAEVFLVSRKRGSAFCVMIRPGRVRCGEKIIFNGGKVFAEVLGKNEVAFNTDNIDDIYKLGVMPLPPYIKRTAQDSDNIYYQTVYARREGAVASPTAGLHFTDELIQKIKKSGVNFAHITLHVGLGTFRPLKSEDITKHKMEPEYFQVPPDAAKEIEKARKEKKRIIAVGTTSLRALESYANGVRKGYTDLFIYPGYKFKLTDCLLTNFHLPKTTLFMLVCAFCSAGGAGTELAKKAYQEAIDKKYRFYSYGDAMLII